MSATSLVVIALGLVLGAGLFLLVTRVRPKSRVSSRKPIPWRRLALSLAVGAVLLALTVALTGVIGLSIAVAGLGASILPWLHVRRAKRALATAQAAFPEVIETLISRVRSGDSLLGALGRSGGDAPPSVAAPLTEFARSYIHTGNADVCLDQLKNAWGSATGDILVETVRVAHFTGGGRTLEVLRDLADQVRSDQSLLRDIEAKQSWLRVAARVGVAAPWVVLVFLSFRAEAVAAYNSPVGIALLVAGLAITVGAYWLMSAMPGSSRKERVFAA